MCILIWSSNPNIVIHHMIFIAFRGQPLTSSCLCDTALLQQQLLIIIAWKHSANDSVPQPEAGSGTVKTQHSQAPPMRTWRLCMASLKSIRLHSFISVCLIALDKDWATVAAMLECRSVCWRLNIALFTCLLYTPLYTPLDSRVDVYLVRLSAFVRLDASNVAQNMKAEKSYKIRCNPALPNFRLVRLA